MGKVIRILTGLIDFIIAYLALYLVMTLLGVQETSRDLLAQVLYILYGVIFSSSFSGKTIGRFFGHLHLDYYRSDRFFLCLISREVSKMLSSLPSKDAICTISLDRPMLRWMKHMNEPIETSPLAHIPTLPLLLLVIISYLGMTYLAKISDGYFKWRSFLLMQVGLSLVALFLKLNLVLVLGLVFFDAVLYIFKLSKY